MTWNLQEAAESHRLDLHGRQNGNNTETCQLEHANSVGNSSKLQRSSSNAHKQLIDVDHYANCGGHIAEGPETLKEDASDVKSETSVEPGKTELVFDNVADGKHTQIVLTSRNRVGLLCDVMSSFQKLDICVLDAQVTTSGTKVLDIFKVQNAHGAQLPESSWDKVRAEIVGVSVVPVNQERLQYENTQAQTWEMVVELNSRIVSILEMVVVQHDGDTVVVTANTLMDGFKQLGENHEPRLHAELMRFIKVMDPQLLLKVVRYLNLVSAILNTIEEYARMKMRSERAHDLDAKRVDHLWVGSFYDVFKDFKSKGVSTGELQAELDRLVYSPVWTAHPTEARRRVVMNSLRRMFVLLQQINDPRLHSTRAHNLQAELECEVETLWRTDEMRDVKPSVLDEILNGLTYYRHSLLDATLELYRNAESSLVKVYGPETEPGVDVNVTAGLEKLGMHVPSCIKFGSWIGGDRDGNPFVKPDTTEAAALLQSRLILSDYVTRLYSTSIRLTHSSKLHSIDPVFQARLNTPKMLDIASRISGLSLIPSEPYRVFVTIMKHRIEQNLHLVNAQLRKNKEIINHERDSTEINDILNAVDIVGRDPQLDAYKDDQEYLEDLHVLSDSLKNEGSTRLVDNIVKDLIRLAETFGFHLATLDVRQESDRHQEAVAEILGSGFMNVCPEYNSLTPIERFHKLLEVIKMEPPSQAKLAEWLPKMTANTCQSVQLLQAIANVKKNISAKGIGAYCISMAQAADDVMEVLILGWFVNQNLVKYDAGAATWTCNMYVSPLFETIEDLEEMPVALNILMNSPQYREMLEAATGSVQEVMLGYSDSCKDGGVLASTFGLYLAQKKVQEISERTGVRFRVFHGRGGSLGRGSAPSFESILSLPPGSVKGETKFTEQGEIITYRYGNKDTAVYELACGLTGLLKASHPLTLGFTEDKPEYLEVAEFLSKKGREAYKELTENTPGFYDYYYESTVVGEISLMNMGSRPARRATGDRTKASLRAIPWVFAWAQSRVVMPGWFGVGSALSEYSAGNPERIMTLQRMHDEWPFFHNLISSVQMALFKADVEIMKEYARLCEDRITETLVFTLLEKEYRTTESNILITIQDSKLLSRQYLETRNSFKSRNHFLKPLNYIQSILLGRKNGKETLTDEALAAAQEALLRTIKAIASSIRNTG